VRSPPKQAEENEMNARINMRAVVATGALLATTAFAAALTECHNKTTNKRNTNREYLRSDIERESKHDG
jgi:hypothetical protein